MMTTWDIETHIRDTYGIEVSDTTVSRITDKKWLQRLPEAIYAPVFPDAIHYHIRSEVQITKEAVCISMELNRTGCPAAVKCRGKLLSFSHFSDKMSYDVKRSVAACGAKQLTYDS